MKQSLRSFLSHGMVSIITALLVLNVNVLHSRHQELLVPIARTSMLNTAELPLVSHHNRSKISSTNLRLNQDFSRRSENLYNRVNLSSSCPSSNRITIAPRLSMAGMGHKCTELFWFLWYAIRKGHCFCLDAKNFGDDDQVYRLLLESFVPACPSDANLVQKTTKGLESENLTLLVMNPENSNTIYHLSPDMGDVWPTQMLQKQAPGNGNLLAFMDNFLKDNQLIPQVIYPWYMSHKTISSAFSNQTLSLLKDNLVIPAVFHLRVGDIVLEAKETYWRNLLSALEHIVQFEWGEDHKIHIYWVYFQALFRGPQGTNMRQKLSDNKIGDWPSEPDMLPASHRFLAEICKEMKSIKCFYKFGTNILETIDLFVESKVVYVSGSSFSQVLSLFQKEGGVKLQALPKELNYWGKEGKGTVPFLRVSTGGFSSLRHYYIDGTGELFSEHFSYLRMKEPTYPRPTNK